MICFYKILNPQSATLNQVFDMGALHPSSPTSLLLKGMRDTGQI